MNDRLGRAAFEEFRRQNGLDRPSTGQTFTRDHPRAWDELEKKGGRSLVQEQWKAIAEAVLKEADAMRLEASPTQIRAEGNVPPQDGWK